MTDSNWIISACNFVEIDESRARNESSPKHKLLNARIRSLNLTFSRWTMARLHRPYRKPSRPSPFGFGSVQPSAKSKRDETFRKIDGFFKLTSGPSSLTFLLNYFGWLIWLKFPENKPTSSLVFQFLFLRHIRAELFGSAFEHGSRLV